MITGLLLSVTNYILFKCELQILKTAKLSSNWKDMVCRACDFWKQRSFRVIRRTWYVVHFVISEVCVFIGGEMAEHGAWGEEDELFTPEVFQPSLGACIQALHQWTFWEVLGLVPLSPQTQNQGNLTWHISFYWDNKKNMTWLISVIVPSFLMLEFLIFSLFNVFRWTLTLKILFLNYPNPEICSLSQQFKP